jgi:hypothetical protein
MSGPAHKTMGGRKASRPARDAFSALALAVHRVNVAAMLARAVADHVPAGGDSDKLDCLDAIEVDLLRPAAAALDAAFQDVQLERGSK